MQPSCMTIQMKAVEQYFHVVHVLLFFIIIDKTVLTFHSVEEAQVEGHSDGSY